MDSQNEILMVFFQVKLTNLTDATYLNYNKIWISQHEKMGTYNDWAKAISSI